jgi:hypothetical protein
VKRRPKDKEVVPRGPTGPREEKGNESEHEEPEPSELEHSPRGKHQKKRQKKWGLKVRYEVVGAKETLGYTTIDDGAPTVTINESRPYIYWTRTRRKAAWAAAVRVLVHDYRLNSSEPAYAPIRRAERQLPSGSDDLALEAELLEQLDFKIQPSESIEI